MLNLSKYNTKEEVVYEFEKRRIIRQEIEEQGEEFLDEINDEVTELYDELVDAELYGIENIGIGNISFDGHLQDIIVSLETYLTMVYIEPYCDEENVPDEVYEAFINLNNYIGEVVKLRNKYIEICDANETIEEVDLSALQNLLTDEEEEE